MGRLTSAVRDVRHGRQIIMVASVVLALALGGILAIAVAGHAMNREAVRTQTQLVDNALTQTIVDALNGVQTVAYWDNAVRRLYAPMPNREWLDYEIGEYLTQVYGHDAVWILDPTDRPIYAYTPRDKRGTAALNDLEPDLSEMIRIVRSGREDGRRQRNPSFRSNQSRYDLNSKGSPGYWSAHIVSDHGQAAILSVMTIVPSTSQLRLKGKPHLIVTVMRIGPHQLRGFADALLIPSLRATSLAVPARLSGQYVVETDKGVPIERYEWNARQPGDTLLHYVLPLFVLVTIVSALLLVTTLRRMQSIAESLVDKEREASFLASYDPLSSLPNRRLFGQQLETLLAETTAEQRMTLAICDLDNFKTINDTLGHEQGDLLIKVVAERLRGSFPECVHVARFGGDEFALMHTAPWLSVEEFGERIQRSFAEPIELSGTPTHVGVSTGIAIAPDHGCNPTDLMRNADIALYEAKDAGRSRYALYHSGMRDQIFARKEREARILKVLEAEQFELHYQPVVDLRAARVSGLEALVRWPTDDPMPMYPGDFIPIAESAGLMLRLGDWIIRKALSDSLRWPDIWVSINLSPLQIKAPDLLGQLSRHLRATSADPNRIMFEITEGLLLDSTAEVRQTLHGIRAMGFRLGLDDFGTGYSSLSYLQEFTFDKLKIDRSFICDGKLDAPRSASLVKAVIDIGRALGIEVVAEGVEHLKDALILKTLGCEQIQGWLYGRALPPVEATQHVAALTAALKEPVVGDTPPSLRLATS